MRLTGGVTLIICGSEGLPSGEERGKKGGVFGGPFAEEVMVELRSSFAPTTNSLGKRRGLRLRADEKTKKEERKGKNILEELRREGWGPFS